MKNLIFLALLLISFSSCGQHGHGTSHGSHSEKSKTTLSTDTQSKSLTNFPTVGFKKIHEETIPYPVDKVFPLFEPQGRPLLYSKWKPTVLRKGENGSLKGHVEFSKYDSLDVLLTVTEYNPKEGYIQYLVVWDDFEIQRIDIYCKQGEKKNSTKVTWVEYNAGLYEKGVSLVSMFVKEGYLVKVVERYIKGIENRLQNEVK